MNEWLFVYENFDPQQERLRETLCTLGNGYFATRGAAAECKVCDVHYPGTYLAGGYNRLKTEIAGKIIENEDLVNIPNWLPLTFRIANDKWFNLNEIQIINYRQELDIKHGILKRIVQFQDHEGRQTKMINRRLVHMMHPHIAAQETILTPENWEGSIEIHSALDGRIINAGVERYRDLNNKHLNPITTDKINEETIYLETQTNQSKLNIVQTARTRVFKDGELIPCKGKISKKPDYIGQQFSVDVAKGNSLSIEKIVSLYTSRDKGISEASLESRQDTIEAESFQNLEQSHVMAWEHLWRRFKIDFEATGDGSNQQINLILHLYMFHLLQTVSLHTMDEDVGVPARGLHGEAYRGHIFWDELFIFPLLNFRVPEISRALLMYRYRRLDEAQIAAKQAGYKGAMFPWQSGSNGREESQKIHFNPKSGRWIPDNSNLQHHVNAAIAYNLWQYYQVTTDTEFLLFYGAEILLEIAHFWSSIATYNKELDRYEILEVMGPDEYHDAYPDAEIPGLRNNAYTNIMAVWTLKHTLKLFDILPELRCKELCEKLDITEQEKSRWLDITHKMRVIFHEDGIISQFEGYDQLQEFDWEAYKKKYQDLQRLDRILEAENDTPNRYKISKQADVLMLFYLFSSEELGEIFKGLGYPFEYETIPKNIDYYISRTSHGSTLSRIVHSWVLTRSDRIRSWNLFKEALQSNVSDIQGGTISEGIHLGAMAGTIDILQRAYMGIEARGEALWFNPILPEGLKRMHLHLRYRGHPLEVELTSDIFKIHALPCCAKPIQIGFRDETFELKMGEMKELKLKE